jgi:hypothetical protein
VRHVSKLKRSCGGLNGCKKGHLNSEMRSWGFVRRSKECLTQRNKELFEFANKNVLTKN